MEEIHLNEKETERYAGLGWVSECQLLVWQIHLIPLHEWAKNDYFKSPTPLIPLFSKGREAF